MNVNSLFTIYNQTLLYAKSENALSGSVTQTIVSQPVCGVLLVPYCSCAVKQTNMDFRCPGGLVCMMIQGRCDVTPLMVTRELSCSASLDINSFTESCAGTEGIPSQQRGRAHLASVYIRHSDRRQSPEEDGRTKHTDKAAQRSCVQENPLFILDTKPAQLGNGHAWIQVSETSTGPAAGAGRIRKDHAALQAEVQRECDDGANGGLQRRDARDRQEQPRPDGVGCGGPEEDEAPLEASLHGHGRTGFCGGQLGSKAFGRGPQGTTPGNSITEF